MEFYLPKSMEFYLPKSMENSLPLTVKPDFAFMGEKVFAKNKEAVVIYGFMLLLWIFRVVMAIVYSHCCGNVGK